MANVPELFDITGQIEEDARRASLDQPGSSKTSNVPAQPQPTLGEEVNEVIGQLGRFWGGFQKQVGHMQSIQPIYLPTRSEPSRFAACQERPPLGGRNGTQRSRLA